MPPPPEWELDYAAWQETLMARRLKPVPKEFTDDKRVLDEQASSGPSSESRWQPAPLETVADRSGDRKTTRRRLDQRIFMLIKKKNGSWEFPHVALEQGENTRTGAERALREVLGDGDGKFQSYFVGNAPAGHVALTSGNYFFHRCQLIQGAPPSLAGDGEWSEIAWAAKDELDEYIKDAHTLELLQKML
jgi:large subunit ribosomal protein L46